MVLHLRGCGRVARRRLHCWIGSRSSPCGGSRDPFRISGGAGSRVPVRFPAGPPRGSGGSSPPSRVGRPPVSPFPRSFLRPRMRASRSGGLPRIRGFGSRGPSYIPGRVPPVPPFSLSSSGPGTRDASRGLSHIRGASAVGGDRPSRPPRGGGAGPYPGHSDRGPGSADPDAAPHARGSYFRPSPIRRPSPDVPFPYAFRTFRALRPPSGNATTSNRLMLNRLMTVMLDISPV